MRLLTDCIRRTVERDTGAFEQELISRGAVQILRTRQAKFTKKKARKQEKAQRQWELRRSADDSDTESVLSAATSERSSTTAETAVDDAASAAGEAPVGKDISDVEEIGEQVGTITPWPQRLTIYVM